MIKIISLSLLIFCQITDRVYASERGEISSFSEVPYELFTKPTTTKVYSQFECKSPLQEESFSRKRLFKFLKSQKIKVLREFFRENYNKVPFHYKKLFNSPPNPENIENYIFLQGSLCPQMRQELRKFLEMAPVQHPNRRFYECLCLSKCDRMEKDRLNFTVKSSFDLKIETILPLISFVNVKILSFNNILKNFPPEICQIKTLTGLSIVNTDLSESLFLNFMSQNPTFCTQLITLKLIKCHLKEISPVLKLMTHLRKLDISENPDVLKSNPRFFNYLSSNLKVICMRDCKIKKFPEAEEGLFPNLEYFSLTKNPIKKLPLKNGFGLRYLKVLGTEVCLEKYTDIDFFELKKQNKGFILSKSSLYLEE